MQLRVTVQMISTSTTAVHVWVDCVGFIVADTHKSPTKLRLRILGNRKDSKQMEKGRRFRFLLWLGQNQGIWAPSSTLSWVGCNLRDSSTTDRSHLLWGLPSHCAIKDPPTVGIGSPFIAGLDWDRSIKWRYSSFIIYSINLLELHFSHQVAWHHQTLILYTISFLSRSIRRDSWWTHECG